MHPSYVASRVVSVARALGLRAEWNESERLCDLPWRVFLGSDGQRSVSALSASSSVACARCVLLFTSLFVCVLVLRPDREAQLQSAGTVSIDPQVIPLRLI